MKTKIPKTATHFIIGLLVRNGPQGRSEIQADMCRAGFSYTAIRNVSHTLHHMLKRGDIEHEGRLWMMPGGNDGTGRTEKT